MPAQSNLRFTLELTGLDPIFTAVDVLSFELNEGLCEPFRLELDLASHDRAIDFAQVMDHAALFTIWHGPDAVRHVHGIVTHFAQHDTGFHRTRYRAVVEPRLARLRHTAQWRIFQGKSVPEIAQAVLKAHAQTADYEQRLTRTHTPREYCVQAGDTDYDFIERLMREEGIYFDIQHSADGHRLVHCDRLAVHGGLSTGPVIYQPRPGGDRPAPAVHRVRYMENLRSTRQSQRDHSFHSPRHGYPQQADAPGEPNAARYERAEYPGRYRQQATGQAFTLDRLRGHRRDARMAIIEGDDARLLPGKGFELQGHPRADLNRRWRPTRLVHYGTQYGIEAAESAGAEQGTTYRNLAELVPDDVEWRAEPLPRPTVPGPQPALVVGPPGEEIYTDEWGRVKVQFSWDREGRHDEHSSGWIRVAQGWAGGGYGQMALPRIGQEVIVDYLDGDCDQPIVMGRTYNVLQRPPYALPHHKTRTTIRSQTHRGDGFNELRFEDEAGQEEIYIHAQKDQNVEVVHDASLAVGRHRSERIGEDDTQSVGHDRSRQVGNDETVQIGANQRVGVGGYVVESVGMAKTESILGAKALSIGGAYQTTVGAAMNTTVGLSQTDEVMGDKRVYVGKHYEIEAGDELRITVGESLFVMTSDGTVTVNGKALNFTGDDTVRIDGEQVDIN